MKPMEDKIEPINKDNLNGKIEKLVDIFDQSCSSFIKVYPDLPWALSLCSTFTLPILFVIPKITANGFIHSRHCVW